MANWGFLTNHARVLLCITQDPAARLRDIAASLGITERSAHGIVADLAEAGYVVKQRDGRRNRYQVKAHPTLPERGTTEPAIGEVLALLLRNIGSRDGPPGPAAADQPDGAAADQPDGAAADQPDGAAADQPDGAAVIAARIDG
jgi:MarR family